MYLVFVLFSVLIRWRLNPTEELQSREKSGETEKDEQEETCVHHQTLTELNDRYNEIHESHEKKLLLNNTKKQSWFNTF